MTTRYGLAELLNKMRISDCQDFKEFDRSFNIFVESLYTVFAKRNTIFFVDMITSAKGCVDIMFSEEVEIIENTLAYNLNVLGAILFVWSASERIVAMEEEYKENRKRYHMSVLEYYEKYTDNKNISIPLEFEAESTFFQVDIMNSTVPFFLKRVMGVWVDNINSLIAKQNRGAKQEVIKNNINLIFIQEYQNQTGMYKNIAFHSDVSCTNSTINEDQIKKQYYNDVDDLDFFNLKESYIKVSEREKKNSKVFDKKVFGSMFVVINTTQEFICESLKMEMSKVGIGIVKVDKSVWEKRIFTEAYDLALLHKLNLKE